MATSIGPISPVSQFPLIQTDPWTNAINAYMGVKQGQGQGLLNQANKEKMPFVAPKEQEALRAAILMNEGREFSNQKTKTEQPYWEQMAKADAEKAQMYPEIQRNLMNYQDAQAERARELNRQGPRIGPGIAGKWDAYEKALNEGNNEKAKAIMDEIKYDQTMAQRAAARSMPKAEFAEAQGVYKTMGYSGPEAADMVMRQIPYDQAAREIGYPLENLANIVPTNALTTTNLGKAQMRAGTDAALEYFSEISTKGILPYLGTGTSIFGFSPKQLMDTFSEDNNDQLSDMMLAYALNYEESAETLRLAGIESGITAIQGQTEHRMKELKPVFEKANKEAWKMFQEKLTKANREAAKRFYHSSRNLSTLYGQDNKNNSLTSSIKENLEGNPSASLQSLSDDDFYAEYEKMKNQGAR